MFIVENPSDHWLSAGPDCLNYLQKRLDATPDIHCTLSSTGSFLEVNKGAFYNWGYHPEELAGKNLFLFLEDSKNKELPLAEILSQKKPVHFYNKFLQKQGKTVLMHWTAQWDEEDSVIYCTARNITERKELKHQVQTLQVRLKKVMGLAKMGYWKHDLRTGRTHASDEVYQLLGLSKREYPVIRKEIFLSLIHPDDLPIVSDNIHNLISQPYNNYEYRLIRPDGAIVYLKQVGTTETDADGNVVLIAGTIQDITDIRKAEEETQKANQRFELIAKATNDVVWDWDLETSTIWWSDNFISTFGYPSASAFDFLLECMHPNDKDRILSSVDASMKRLEPFWSNEYRIKKGDSSYATVLVRGNILYNKDQKPFRMIGSMLDITERKNYEKNLQNLNTKLRNLSAHLRDLQEKEKGQVAYELHEELGQQLARIKFDIAQLGDTIYQEDPSLNNRVEGVLRLLSASMDLVRKVSAELYPSILNVLGLTEALEWLCKDFSQKAGIAVVFLPDLEEVNLPEETSIGLFRIFQECLTNTRLHPGAKEIVSYLRVEEAHLVMGITSNGKVPELFSKEDKEHIELFNIKERVAMLGGRMEITCEENDEVYITVRIPL